MTDERTPLSPMVMSDSMHAVTNIGVDRPWNVTGPGKFPVPDHSAISPFYWIGATVLGSIIWFVVVRML
jgi:hypothetical protein